MFSKAKALSIRRWTREVRPMIGLAMPIVAGMLGQMLIGLTDTIMVGRVGVVPLAASAFVNAIAHLPMVFAMGLLSSVAVLTSQAYGARQPQEAGEVLRHGLVLALLAGVASAIVLLCLVPILGVFRQPAEVIRESGPYLVLVAGSMVPILLAQVCKQYSESLNRPWEPMLIMLGGVLLNVFLNWVLIYGNLGAPALGLAGAGWATVIARTEIAIAMLLLVLRSRLAKAFHPAKWTARLSSARFGRLTTLGWPVAAQLLLEVSAFAFAGVMMGWISAEAIAAHQIAITCAATSFMFALGTGMAACIRVGHAWGAGQYRRMRRIGFVGVASSAAMMALFAVLFVVAGEPLAKLFVSSHVVIALTVQLLLVAAVFQIADAIQVSAILALRGMGDVRMPAVIAVLAYWALAVPLGYWLAFPLGQGAVGIWIALAIGLGVAATALLWRFHMRTRKTAVTEFAAERANPSNAKIPNQTEEREQAFVE